LCRPLRRNQSGPKKLVSSLPTGEFEQALINRPILPVFYGLRTRESWFAFSLPPPTPVPKPFSGAAPNCLLMVSISKLKGHYSAFAEFARQLSQSHNAKTVFLLEASSVFFTEDGRFRLITRTENIVSVMNAVCRPLALREFYARTSV